MGVQNTHESFAGVCLFWRGTVGLCIIRHLYCSCDTQDRFDDTQGSQSLPMVEYTAYERPSPPYIESLGALLLSSALETPNLEGDGLFASHE